MKILWKSSLSGLADRLLDLYLLATISKISGSKLCVLWQENTNVTEFQAAVWPTSRKLDWKPEIFLQYIELPKFISFVNESDWSAAKANEYYEFSHYLGGIHSPESFYAQYEYELKEHLGVTITNDDFVKQFYQLIHQIKPTRQLNELLGSMQIPDIGVHLRRTDKVVLNPDVGQIHTSELSFLNAITRIYLNSILKMSRHQQICLYFCSDDPLVRVRWEKLYCEDKNLKIIKLPPMLKDYETTYFDLFMLSRCKSIVMSQRHSNFSLFASLINRSKLVYFYKNNPMNVAGHFKNMKLFTLSLLQKIHLKLKLIRH